MVVKGMENLLAGIGDERRRENHSDHSTVKIIKSYQKMTGDLGSLPVSKTSVKDHYIYLYIIVEIYLQLIRMF